LARTAQPPLGRLYSDHHHWLHDWLRRKLGCTHQAADLAHDTFLRVLLAPPRDDLREPRAWLVTVAHGLMVNHLRRQDLERAYLDALANHPPAFVPSPEERAVILEALCQIDALLDGLPHRARSAFLMSQLEGLAYGDIAARLGVSVSMVKKYMLQAMTHCMSIERP
jgi:RNA polymerase sigma factor (sigma-70 family)